MKRKLLAVLAIVVYTAACGCAQYSATVPDTIEYMGLSYGQSERVVLPAEMLYFTGCTYKGMKLYADGTGEPEKVPLHLTAGDASGHYYPFSRYRAVRPAYAYTPYGRYNAGESVTIGLMNERGGRIELRNSAPYEVEKKVNGEWKTVYRPVAAQVITPLENGTYKEWSWDQEGAGEGGSPEGDFRATVDGQYTVAFSITKGAPVVRSETVDYDNGTLQNTFMGVPEHEAFAQYYTTYSPAVRGDVEGQMLFKAWMKGMDAENLRAALEVAGNNSLEMLPCLAVHADYNGKPAWIIVYNWGMGGESLSHIRYYAVDDASGKVAYFSTCT